MKKIIEFGYNKKDYLDNGIEGVYPYKGEYIDVVCFNSKNYLFTKGVSNLKKDKIEVREIIEDVYLDGSFVVYGNFFKSKECQILEQYFNQDKIKQLIKKGGRPLDILLDLDLPFKNPYIIPINDDKFVMVVLIENNVFENTRNLLIENRNKSFAELVNKDLTKKHNCK